MSKIVSKFIIFISAFALLFCSTTFKANSQTVSAVNSNASYNSSKSQKTDPEDDPAYSCQEYNAVEHKNKPNQHIKMFVSEMDICLKVYIDFRKLNLKLDNHKIKENDNILYTIKTNNVKKLVLTKKDVHGNHKTNLKEAKFYLGSSASLPNHYSGIPVGYIAKSSGKVIITITASYKKKKTKSKIFVDVKKIKKSSIVIDTLRNMMPSYGEGFYEILRGVKLFNTSNNDDTVKFWVLSNKKLVKLRKGAFFLIEYNQTKSKIQLRKSTYDTLTPFPTRLLKPENKVGKVKVIANLKYGDSKKYQKTITINKGPSKIFFDSDAEKIGTDEFVMNLNDKKSFKLTSDLKTPPFPFSVGNTIIHDGEDGAFFHNSDSSKLLEGDGENNDSIQFLIGRSNILGPVALQQTMNAAKKLIWTPKNGTIGTFDWKNGVITLNPKLKGTYNFPVTLRYYDMGLSKTYYTYLRVKCV